MLNRRIAAGLALVAGVVALNALTACVPSEGNPTVATPVQTPPPPVPVPHCQIVWANLATNSVTAFVVDAPTSAWTNGAQTDMGGGGTFTRAYLTDLNLADVQANHALDVRPGKDGANNPVAVINTGSFTITTDLAGPADGGTVSYDGPANDPAMALGTDMTYSKVVGAMGKGTWTGTFQMEGPGFDTTPAGTPVEVNLTTAGNMTLGVNGTWGICYGQL